MKWNSYLNNFLNRIPIKTQIAYFRKELEINVEETEVIQYLCPEFTSLETGEKLNINTKTVESITEHLIERFGLKNTRGFFLPVKNTD